MNASNELTPMKNPTTSERTSERELVVTRTFKAPPRVVFDVDGTNTMAFFGKYLEVTPHSRIVWTNDESGEDGAVTTVTLEESGGKTMMVLHELYRSKEVRDAALASGAYDGMGETFEQLDEVLVTLDE